jgi:hypothetical protein
METLPSTTMKSPKLQYEHPPSIMDCQFAYLMGVTTNSCVQSVNIPAGSMKYDTFN